MKQLRNKKGMTLIEIVVVLLIMSIVLVVMGSLILNSFNYFGKTTEQDINKRSLDSISEYVREELLYAGDVRVQNSMPDGDGWNYLYVIDGRLYKNDEQVYSESFYNKNNLLIKIRGFDKYRLDLKYSYQDLEGSKAYATEDTLELLNLKIKIEQESEFNPFSNISSITDISKQVKIYYQKTIITEEPEEPDDPEDEESSNNCLNGYNNRGRFVENSNYKIGEMVFYNGDWWLNYHTTWIIPAPDAVSVFWKRMNPYYISTSAYDVGDIIINEKDGNYYECIKQVLSWAPSLSDMGYWRLIEKENAKTNVTCYINPDKYETVANKLDYDNLKNYEEYEHGKHYEVGTIVYQNHDDGYVEYYLKVLDSNGNNGPQTNPSSGWQRLTREWDENSAYKKGDVVIYVLNSHIHFIQAQQDITKKVNIVINNSSFDNTYWKEIHIGGGKAS